MPEVMLPFCLRVPLPPLLMPRDGEVPPLTPLITLWPLGVVVLERFDLSPTTTPAAAATVMPEATPPAAAEAAKPLTGSDRSLSVVVY